jgi:hypothetical protein
MPDRYDQCATPTTAAPTTLVDEAPSPCVHSSFKNHLFPHSDRFKNTKGFTRLVLPHSLTHLSVGLYDYENIYPTDAYGDETGPNARVWKTYLDECHNYDEEQMNGWKESIDMLMIFVCTFDGGQEVHS